MSTSKTDDKTTATITLTVPEMRVIIRAVSSLPETGLTLNASFETTVLDKMTAALFGAIREREGE